MRNFFEKLFSSHEEKGCDSKCVAKSIDRAKQEIAIRNPETAVHNDIANKSLLR